MFHWVNVAELFCFVHLSVHFLAQGAQGLQSSVLPPGLMITRMGSYKYKKKKTECGSKVVGLIPPLTPVPANSEVSKLSFLQWPLVAGCKGCFL